MGVVQKTVAPDQLLDAIDLGRNRAVGAGHPYCWSVTNLELVAAVFGKEDLRLDPGLVQGCGRAGVQRDRNAAAPEMRTRARDAVSGIDLEFLLERRGDLQASLGLKIRERRFRKDRGHASQGAPSRSTMSAMTRSRGVAVRERVTR